MAVHVEILAVLVLSYLAPSDSTEHIICSTLTPTTPNPGSGPCLSLSDYASNATYYFTSDSSFSLPEGEHYLDTELTIENVTKVTMSGLGPRTSIIIVAGSGISFVNSQEILLSSLEIRYDGGIENTSHFAFLFDNSHSIQINNIRFARLDSDHHSHALEFIQSTTDIFNCSFTGGQSYYGGAVRADYSSIRFSGTNSYANNVAQISGGAIFANNSALIFNGTNTFIHNEARTPAGEFSKGGDAMFILSSDVIFNGHVIIQENGLYALDNFLIGVAMLARNASISIEGRASFTNNYGGAVTLLECHFNCTGQAQFANNKRNGRTFGAAMYAENSTVFLDGDMNFTNNTVSSGVGGAIFAFNSSINLHGHILFAKNMAETGGAVYIDRSDLRHNDGNVTYLDNDADHKGGGVYATNSTIAVSSVSNYIGNRAMRGGAVALEVNAQVLLQAPVLMRFDHNEADFGGGIFHSDLNAIVQCQNITVERENCFFKVETANSSDLTDIHLIFDSNQARQAGTVLYGGSLRTCHVQVNGEQEKVDTLDIILSLITIVPLPTTSFITSDPLKVCFCYGNTTNCTERRTTVSVRRGQIFSIPVITVGQFDMPVPTSVRAYIDGNTGSTELTPQSHIIDEIKCTNVEFRVFTAHGESSKQLVMFPDGPCGNIANTRTFVDVTIEACPPGFDLVDKSCTCEERLLTAIKDKTLCNVDTGLIQRPANSWIKPLWDKNLSSYLGFIWNPQCRTVYCSQESEVLLNFSNPNSDDQCNENRTGILCGACKESHSLTLSSFNCEICDSKFISLLLFFGVAGIALIAILFALQITVAAGTTNSLILYVNLINICKDLFFPPLKTQINPLTIFISWTNLDFGFPTCFYDGLDYYSYTWLQYAFPFYLWFLIGVIVITCKVSTKVGKLFGSNPIAVLATVILLSFTKLLQNSVDILSSTVLEYPGGRMERVWYADPNIPFFQGKHLILSIFAIVVITFLLLPYIFLLTFGYLLQAFSGRKGFTWFNNFTPLLDAYYAPFKKWTRYWTGFLLLVRSGVFLGLSVIVNSNVTLVSVTALFTGIAIIPWLSKRVYKNFYVDAIEASYILNLCILTSVTYHVQATNGNQVVLTYVFVGIAFVEFVGIVIFHVCLRLKLTDYLCKKRGKAKLATENYTHRDAIEMTDPTTTVVELREPLLEDL